MHWVEVGCSGGKEVVRSRFTERKQEFGLVFVEFGLSNRYPSGDVGGLAGRHHSKKRVGGLELGGGFLGQWTILCDTIMMDIHQHTFVQTHRMYNSRVNPNVNSG